MNMNIDTYLKTGKKIRLQEQPSDEFFYYADKKYMHHTKDADIELSSPPSQTRFFLVNEDNSTSNLIDVLDPEFVKRVEMYHIQLDTQQKIQEAKAYLAATDYVTAKYNDMVTVTGSMTKAEFLAQYADVYAQRAEARAVINMGEA